MMTLRHLATAMARLPGRALRFFNTPGFLLHYHAWAAVFWAIMIVPSYVWFRTSVFWVIVVSLYANLATEWGAWQSVRAEIQALKATLAAIEQEVVADRRSDDVLADIKVRIETLQTAITDTPRPS